MVLFSPPFREISMFTRPGARWNEDAVGGGGSFLYVLDGATSLDAAPVMDPVSDAAWLVRETARWLDRHLPEASRPLEDILAQGMARLLDQWSGPRAALPSAGVAIFRRRGEEVEYFGLGDCAASLQLADGTFRTWEETALSALEQRVADQKEALRSYQPEEVAKLDQAIVKQQGNSVLLVVAADQKAVQSVLDTLN